MENLKASIIFCLISFLICILFIHNLLATGELAHIFLIIPTFTSSMYFLSCIVSILSRRSLKKKE